MHIILKLFPSVISCVGTDSCFQNKLQSRTDSTFTVTILEMRKVGHREVKKLYLGHSSRRQNMNLNHAKFLTTILLEILLTFTRLLRVRIFFFCSFGYIFSWFALFFSLDNIYKVICGNFFLRDHSNVVSHVRHTKIKCKSLSL